MFEKIKLNPPETPQCPEYNELYRKWANLAKNGESWLAAYYILYTHRASCPQCKKRMRKQKLTVHIHDSGTPYIKLTDIPAWLRPEFDAWFTGQTCILLDDRSLGVYPWDWDNFMAAIDGRPEFWD